MSKFANGTIGNPRDLELTILGVKPFCVIHKNDAKQYAKALTLKYVHSVVEHDTGFVSVCRFENAYRQIIYDEIMAREIGYNNEALKNKMWCLGVLFGYEADGIREFIKNPPVCTCVHCN